MRGEQEGGEENPLQEREEEEEEARLPEEGQPVPSPSGAEPAAPSAPPLLLLVSVQPPLLRSASPSPEEEVPQPYVGPEPSSGVPVREVGS